MEHILHTQRTEIAPAALPQPDLGPRQIEHDPRPAHAAGRAAFLSTLRSRAEIGEAQALDAVYGAKGEDIDDYVARLHQRSNYRADPIHDNPLYVNVNTPQERDLSEDTRQRLDTVATPPPVYEIAGRRVGDVTPGDRLNEKFPANHVTKYVLSLVKK